VDGGRYVELLGTEGEAFAVAAAKDLAAGVPSCPDWNMAELVRHLGRIHHHKAKIVRRGTAEPPPEPERGFRSELAPRDEGDLLRWYREGLADLVETLADRDPDEPAWSWAGDHRVAFWNRRMAQETAVHRWDAQNAVGEPSGIDLALAGDGIDELLGVFVPGAELSYLGGAGTMHIHCTDVDGEWLVTLEPNAVPTYRLGHARADAAIRGPASDLLLFLWRRLGPESVERLGEAALIESFWHYLEGPSQ
jgi:uncharacterized protein (TIGR03083 family)